MAKMGTKQSKVHKAFLDLKRPFNPTDIYTVMCELSALKEDAIERGLGKLFKDGKLTVSGERPRRKKKKSAPADDF